MLYAVVSLLLVVVSAWLVVCLRLRVGCVVWFAVMICGCRAGCAAGACGWILVFYWMVCLWFAAYSWMVVFDGLAWCWLVVMLCASAWGCVWLPWAWLCTPAECSVLGLWLLALGGVCCRFSGGGFWCDVVWF